MIPAFPQKVFILTQTETGERVRITVEQLQDDSRSPWPSPVSLFDTWKEEIETEPDRNESVRVEVQR